MAQEYNSTSEDGTNFWSDSDEYEYHDIDEDEYYPNDKEAVINSLLEGDISRVKIQFGEDAIKHRVFDMIDDIDVDLKFSLSFLDNEVAKAWGVDRQEPLIVRLHLSCSNYLDYAVPKVDVFQSTMKEKYGIAIQVNKILENFLSKNWDSLSNTSVEQSLASSHNAHRPRTAKAEKHVDKSSVRRLVDMGFTADDAKYALSVCDGNIDRAVAHIVSTSQQPTSDQRDTEVKHAAKKRCGLSAPKIPPDRDSGESSSTSIGSSVMGALHNFGASIMSQATSKRNDEKSTPGLDQGFLVRVMRYTSQRLPTLSDFCVICDERHVYENAAMLKPAVCSRELCVFAFQTLGVMANVAEIILSGPEVVDLLIHMAYAACRSQRRSLIFDPYPTVVDPRNPDTLAFNPKEKKFADVQATLEHLHNMKDMTASSGLKEKLDAKNPLAYPLLTWIVSSNRSHIVKLSASKQIKEMGTTHQYLLMSSAPGKEAVFSQAKKRHGSTFAFHGSYIENWHSIMRHGLMNASGTAHQRNGAAHGAGVYLSPFSNISCRYSGLAQAPQAPKPPQLPPRRPQQGSQGPAQQVKAQPHRPQQGPQAAQNPPKSKVDSRYLRSSNLICLALCEVAKSPSLKKATSSIWVLSEADHVCTRFFFVYEDGQKMAADIDSQSPAFQASVLRAMSKS